jgi:hypothetical protein
MIGRGPIMLMSPRVSGLFQEGTYGLRAEPRAMPNQLNIESEIAADEDAMLGRLLRIGNPSLFTCSECHGTLLKIREEELVRFRYIGVSQRNERGSHLERGARPRGSCNDIGAFGSARAGCWPSG